MLTERQKVRKRWIKALRSGRYKQTSGYLHDTEKVEGEIEHRFCCLGVLCELAVRAKIIPRGKIDDVGIVSYSRKTGGLPAAVRNWAGLVEGQGEFYEDEESYEIGEAKSLSDLNDSGQSFAAIANVIESEPYKLCVKERNDTKRSKS